MAQKKAGGLQDISWPLRVISWLPVARHNSLGFIPSVALQAKSSMDSRTMVVYNSVWTEDPGLLGRQWKKKKSSLSKKQLWCWNNWHTSSAASLWSQLCRLKRGVWVGRGRWQNCQTRHLWEWNTKSVQTSYTIPMGIVIVPGCAFSKRFMPFSNSLKKDKEGPVLFTQPLTYCATWERNHGECSLSLCCNISPIINILFH